MFYVYFQLFSKFLSAYGEAYQPWLKQLLSLYPLIRDFHGTTLLIFYVNMRWLDNARIHHSDQACHKLGLSSIREFLASKNIEPLYLPAYTPEMNPVECCFNIIKGEVRKEQPETYEELELAVERASKLLHETSS